MAPGAAAAKTGERRKKMLPFQLHKNWMNETETTTQKLKQEMMNHITLYQTKWFYRQFQAIIFFAFSLLLFSKEKREVEEEKNK